MTTKEVFEREIQPLVDQVIDLCQEHHISFASLYAMAEDEVYIGCMNYPDGMRNDRLDDVIALLYDMGILTDEDMINDPYPPGRN